MAAGSDIPVSDDDFSRGLSRRQFLKKSGLAMVGVAMSGTLLSACGSLLSEDLPDVHVGYLPITDAAPLLVGHAGGFFEDEGLTSRSPTLFRGWSDIAEAFLANQVNVAHFLMPMTVWMRYGLQAPIQVVAWDHVDGSAVTVREEIGSWEELGGTTLAVPHWYSIHNIVLQMGLRAHGIKEVSREHGSAVASDEANLLVMPPPEMPTALANGTIDGYIVAEPFNAQGEVRSGGRILRFTGDIWRRHACCVVVMREEDINNRPEWARAVLRGIIRAQLWIRQNRQAAARLLSSDESELLPFGSEIIDRAMNHYDHDEYGPTGAIKHPEWESQRIDFYPYPYPSYTRALIEHLQGTTVEGESAFLQGLDPATVAQDLVAYEPVRDALDAVGGAQAFGVSAADAFERTETIEI